MKAPIQEAWTGRRELALLTAGLPRRCMSGGRSLPAVASAEAGRDLDLSQEAVQLFPVEEPARHDDRANTLNVRDVGQRIRVQENQIGRPPGRDGAECLLQAEVPGRIERGRLQGGERFHTTAHHGRELVTYAE